MSKMQVRTLGQKSEVRDDLAWVSTRSQFIGQDPQKPLHLYSTETAVLKQTAGEWRIVHLHWSSQPSEKR